MAPRKGRGRKRKAKKKDTQIEEPPGKLAKEESFNSKVRRIISEATSDPGKNNRRKTYKLDPYTQSGFFTSAQLCVHEDYSCMLNLTNIGKNNNKFYVIQLLDQAGQGFVLFTRWGRVGEKGKFKHDFFLDLPTAVAAFEKKFADKTRNEWTKRDNFEPSPGKYTLLEMDDEELQEDDPTEVRSGKSSEDQKSAVSCCLDARTRLLIKLIFNDDMFKNQMTNMNLDTKKMPLGKLSKLQIAKGLQALIEIENALKDKSAKSLLSSLTSKFYTLIPHNFGRYVPPVISDDVTIREKKEMMMTLSDIELTQSLQKNMGTVKHPLDEKYEKLECNLEVLDKKSGEYKMLQQYATACPDSRRGTLLDIWRVDRSGEQERFDEHKKINYRKLLWHGTNVAVVAAILKAGLRIMPHSGGRVGKGIYFASEHSKSSYYVDPHYGNFEGEDNIGFMLLVEVALGNMKFIKKDDSSLEAPPSGYDSVVARGSSEPDAKKDIVKKFDGEDVTIPTGKPIPQKEYKNSYFSQSEYLIYKESQARIRYLLKFSFK